MDTTVPTTETEILTAHEIAAEVAGLGDAAILGAAREVKQATVPAPQQRRSTARGWTFSGSID
jgi:hypothetical protein